MNTLALTLEDGSSYNVDILYQCGRLCVHQALGYARGFYTLTEIRTTKQVIACTNAEMVTMVQLTYRLAPFFDEMPEPGTSGWGAWCNTAVPHINAEISQLEMGGLLA